MKKILAGLLVCAAALTPFADATDLSKLTEADNGFAFDLLQQMASKQPAENIFISPYSVSTVFQMLGNGAAGKTRDELQQVLKTGGLTPQALNEASRELNQSLQSQTSATLDLADSIWYRKDIQLKPAFAAANKDFFQSELDAVDFTDPKTAGIINDWADNSTRGKITDIVSFPFPPDTAVILANAIYFKGKWADPFDTNLTQPRDFNLPGGSVKQPPMMSQDKKFSYQEGADFQAVKLPYAGGELQMLLFLPATNSSPQKLLTALNGTNWNNIVSKFSENQGKLVFPKFKLNCNFLLNEPLQALGMRSVFSHNDADFSTMTDDPGIAVDSVTQKSYVDVNEEGTEAAAITTINMTDMAIAEPIQPPFEMIVNRPFFFMITDNATGTILFMGIVNDPAP